MHRLRFAWPWLLVLGFWEMAGRMGWIGHFVLPWPSLVFSAGLAEGWSFFFDAWMSLWRVGLGFVVAVLLGTFFGLAIGVNRRLANTFEPLMNFLRPIPPVAWIPLAILWFGLGDAPAYFLTFIAALFPIVIGAASGVRQIAPEHFQVAQSLGASRAMIFKRVIWPGALPGILNGCRIGFGVAWMAVVAAEMIAARTGLGHLIHVGQDVLRTDLVIAGMAMIGAIGLLGDWTLRVVARRLAPWERI